MSYSPLVKIGALMLTHDLFLQVDNETTKKNRCWYVRWLLLAAILAQWRQLVASNIALDLLHWAMCTVLYRHIATAIKMASKVGAFFHPCFVCCRPNGRQGNTKRVVAQWQHPVASRVALDMPHWAMLSILLQHACMAIKNSPRWRCICFLPSKVARDGGAFVFCHRLFSMTLLVAKDHVMVH
jgi:hypothetical protein